MSLHELPKSYYLFCDGACSGNPGPGGWGALLVDPLQNVTELGGALSPTTNNQMELLATIEGLALIPVDDASIEVYTDSVYVINGITKWIFGWLKKGWKTSTGEAVANQPLWEKLHQQVKRVGPKRVKWHYVPGHTGVAGNERVDEIAVSFAKGEYFLPYSGSLADYELVILPMKLPAKGTKKTFKSSGSKKGYYLSLVDGVLEKHQTWSQCEARVKNRSHAKFKKVTTPDEERAVLKSWGL